jgi:hypothetical protein
MSKTKVKNNSKNNLHPIEKEELEHCIIKWSGVILTLLVVIQIIAMKGFSVYKDIKANIFESTSITVEETEKN